LDVLGRERLNPCTRHWRTVFIDDDADDDRVAFRLLEWFREASELERASEHDG